MPALTSPARADILHLRDGSRHYGEVLAESDDEVRFKIVLADGKSSATRAFARRDVRLVERDAVRAVTPPEDDAPPLTDALDYDQVLREGLELLDDGERGPAVRALQLLVARAPRAQLAELERKTLLIRGRPLAQLLAEARFAQLLAEGAGRRFRARYVTDYEAGAFGALLAQRCDELLAARFDGRSMREWLSSRSDYLALRAESRALARDAGLCVALLSARLSFDPALAGRREERARLVAQRDELSRFAAQLLALPGFTAPEGGAAAGPPLMPRSRDEAEPEDTVGPATRPAPTPPVRPQEP